MKRIGGSVLDQTGFPGYHFIVLTIAFITWLPYWLLTILATFKNLIKPTEKNILLISWIIMGWFFWEFMNSKLPSYSLAAQPALALFMAIEISKRENQQLNKKWLQTGLTLYALIFVLIIIGVPFSGYYFFGNWTLVYLIPMSLILTLLLTQVVKNRNKDLMLFQYLALTGAIFMFLVWACISPVLEKSAVKSFDQVIEAAYNESGQNKNARIIFTGFDIKQTKISLIFYAEKQFGKYEEMHVPEAMMAFNNKQNTVLIIGQKYIKDYEIAFKKRGIPFNPQKILHRSTDDSLKEHNFWVIGNNKD